MSAAALVILLMTCAGSTEGWANCNLLTIFNNTKAIDQTRLQAEVMINLECGGMSITQIYEGYLNIVPGTIICCTPGVGIATAAQLNTVNTVLANVTSIFLMNMDPVDVASSLHNTVFTTDDASIVIAGIKSSGIDLPVILPQGVPANTWIVFRSNPELITLPLGIFPHFNSAAGNFFGVLIQNNSNLQYLPDGLFAGLSLSFIAINENVQLNNLSAGTFQGMEPMAPNSLLRLEGNNFKSLPQNLLTNGHFVNTRLISLYGNNFSTIDKLPSFVNNINASQSPFVQAAQLKPRGFEVGINVELPGSKPQMVIDLFNSGSWVRNLRETLDKAFSTSIPNKVQILLGRQVFDGTTPYNIGQCCDFLQILEEPDGRFIIPGNSVVCQIGTAAPMRVAEFLTDPTMCSCVDRQMVELVNAEIANYTRNGLPLTPTLLEEVMQFCISAGSHIRAYNGTCLNTSICPPGYQVTRMSNLDSIPCGNLSSFTSNLNVTSHALQVTSLALYTQFSGDFQLSSLDSYECIPCITANCMNCPLNINECSTCLPGYYLYEYQVNDSTVESYGFNCNKECPFGTVKTTNGQSDTCTPCTSPNCLACPTHPNICEVCEGGTSLDTKTSPICVSKCMYDMEEASVSSDDYPTCKIEELRRAARGAVMDVEVCAVTASTQTPSDYPYPKPSIGLVGLQCTMQPTSSDSSFQFTGLVGAGIFVIILLCSGLAMAIFRNYKSSKMQGGKLREVMEQVEVRNQVIAQKEAAVDEWLSAFQIREDDVEMMSCVASGGFGKVWKGQWSDSECAIKIPHSQIRTNSTGSANQTLILQMLDKESYEAFVAEAILVCKIRHQNVITMFGYGFFADGQPFLVMEWMSKGSLRSLLDMTGISITWEAKLQAAGDVARGMKYLHGRGLLHRDLKAENCLVNSFGQVKVADFGSSRKLQNQIFLREDQSQSKQKPNAYENEIRESFSRTMTKGIGSLLWMAPEIMEGSSAYGKPSDVYSYAIVLWEILTRSLPWEDLESASEIKFRQELRTRINNHERPQIPEGCTDSVKTLLQKCWSTSPSLRPTFSQIVNYDCIMSSSERIRHSHAAEPSHDQTAALLVRTSTDVEEVTTSLAPRPLANRHNVESKM